MQSILVWVVPKANIVKNDFNEDLSLIKAYYVFDIAIYFNISTRFITREGTNLL